MAAVDSVWIEFARFVEGRSVCVLGPLNTEARADVLACDIVSRMNADLCETEIQRADVLYQNGDNEELFTATTRAIERAKEFPAFVFCNNQSARELKMFERWRDWSEANGARFGAFANARFLKPNPAHVGCEFVNILNHSMRTTAMLGMVALEHARICSPREILVAGQDCYFDGETFPAVRGTHNVHEHVRRYLEIQRTDRRVRFDSGFRRALAAAWVVYI